MSLARAEELAGRGFLPLAELEAARTLVASGEAMLAQARAEAARLRASLADASGRPSGLAVPVRAPADGVVLSVVSESEGVIAEGTPLMTIGDPAAIEVVVDLLSREAVKVKPGDPVVITQWGGEEPIAATVRRVEPSGRLKVSALGIEEQRVNVIVGFPAEPAAQVARLGHGYQVDATIVLWRDERALRVPLGALFRAEDGQWQVLAVERGRGKSGWVRSTTNTHRCSPAWPRERKSCSTPPVRLQMAAGSRRGGAVLEDRTRSAKPVPASPDGD